MNHNYTSEDLILYIYGETTPEVSEDIKAALAIDSALNYNYQQMVQTLRQLDNLNAEPSEACVDSILSYSKNSASMEEIH